MDGNIQTLRNLLEEELSYFTDSDLSLPLEDIFNPATAKKWLIRLLSNEQDIQNELNKRIDMPPERMPHVLSTYLLGNAVRRKLGLSFDMLPRIFPVSPQGDAFGFFWAVICLCHDIGYQYELQSNSRGNGMLAKMASPEGRRELLGISNDLLSIKPENLELRMPDLTEVESQWVGRSIILIRNYESYRREQCAVIDHGIAGGLILYDLLLNMAGKTLHNAPSFRGQTVNVRPALGELSANNSHTRFAICALLMACTVARHNIWTTSDPNTAAVYRSYKLGNLCFPKGGVPADRISFQKKPEEMLFFLSILDTIDPVKGICLRRHIQSVNVDDVLDRVLISANPGTGISGYQTLCIQIDNSKTTGRERFTDQLINHYFNGWLSIHEWLLTAPSTRSAVGCNCHFPIRPAKRWPMGITDSEVQALYWYQGTGDTGRAEAFWRTPNSYQTVNLLMMRGLRGEQTRVCIERQNPHGLFIELWKKTISTLCDIYRAQLKCRKADLPDVCYRVERKESLKQMQRKKKTISFFSSSKGSYLPDLAAQKDQLILLKVSAASSVPFFDYEEIFGKEYSLSYEREVLFPPFLSISLKRAALTGEELYLCDRNGVPPKAVYKVFLTEQKWRKQPFIAKKSLIKFLEAHKSTAAKVLRTIRNQRSFDGLARKDVKIYLKWKECFQKLVYLELKELSFFF